MSLARAIIEQDLQAVETFLRQRVNPNELDEYGFTPLIEAAIVSNLAIAKMVLAYGADVNGQDATGSTALHWAVENNDLALARLLLEHHAHPNAVTLSGQPPLVLALLRKQGELKNVLYQFGADETFAQDFIHVKLLGHLFELVGTASIIDPQNQLIEVDFEGYYLEVTLGLLGDALSQFQNNYGARKLRRYLGLSQVIVEVMNRAAELAKYRQYQTDRSRLSERIQTLFRQEPVIFPIGYEGHAITFVKYGSIFAKCDRREDSRLYDNIMCYRLRHPEVMTDAFMMHLLYDKHSSVYINEELPFILGLEPLTELKIESQISGNCSWANVEACIPTLFFLILASLPGSGESLGQYKSLALHFFNRFTEWNKERSLQFCLQRFREADPLRKAAMAEILAAILFQRCALGQLSDKLRIEKILPVFRGTPYHYILKNYLDVYYYKRPTPEGQQFAELLKQQGLLPR